MKKKRTSNSRLVYSAIGVANLCVFAMFAAILSPQPEPVNAEPVAIVVPEKLTGPTFTKISLGIPSRVVVDSVGIDLPVRTGSYNPTDKTWTLDEQSAFYADLSVPANDSNGSTLIYAHARFGLFAKLPAVTEGATARVYTDSGKVFSYTFVSSRQVDPGDTSIFVSSGSPTLALQTCSGPFDIYRTLALFSLTEVYSL